MKNISKAEKERDKEKTKKIIEKSLKVTECLVLYHFLETCLEILLKSSGSVGGGVEGSGPGAWLDILSSQRALCCKVSEESINYFMI